MGGVRYRTIAEYERLVAELQAALRRCNEAATAEGNDPRTPPDGRASACGIGAIIRKEMAQLGID